MKTSKGILKGAEYEDTIFYTAQCSCMGHEQSLMFDYDSEVPDKVILLLDTRFDINVWRDDGFFKSLWKRIRYASEILFTGYFEWDSDFIFTGEEQIEGYISALQEGMTKMKKAKAKPKIQKAKISISNKGKDADSNGTNK